VNYLKRNQRTNLSGRIALITGGRIKIGFEMALKMLRDGAKVIVTTRFPHDAIKKYKLEADYEKWESQLTIYGLNLSDTKNVENFVKYLLENLSYLDIIVNNAAQTIQKPVEYYQQLIDAERTSNLSLKSPEIHSLMKQDRLLIPESSYFPKNSFDSDGQQLDLRPKNSWVLKLDEIGTAEMMEVQLINAIAPFVINSQLKQLMLKSPSERKFIINVSAMEGQFNRKSKSIYHPHTNMAKAALNMMTRTSAADYAKNGIFMSSVDTGWITDESPHEEKIRKQLKRQFFTPLDDIDAAARIYDPIVQGIENVNEEPTFGHFLKDYQPYPW